LPIKRLMDCFCQQAAASPDNLALLFARSDAASFRFRMAHCSQDRDEPTDLKPRCVDLFGMPTQRR
jgi:hypothetical protein